MLFVEVLSMKFNFTSEDSSFKFSFGHISLINTLKTVTDYYYIRFSIDLLLSI